MRISMLFLLLTAVASQLQAQTTSAVSPSFISAEHRRALLERLPENPFLTNRFAAQRGYVPTNTLAFREYAFDLLLAQANLVNEKWNLDLPGPLNSDHVTRFYAVPRITGVDGSITIKERFGLSIQQGRFEQFRDLLYWSGSWEMPPHRLSSPARTTNGPIRTPITSENAHESAFLAEAARGKVYHAKMMELAKMVNLLTKETALQLAQEALHKLGFTEKQLRLRESPAVNQFTYQPEGGETYPLPLYNVAWRFQDSDGIEPVTMEVSGITKRVVSYFNVAPAARVIPIPTNYYQTLGVPPQPRLWGKQYGYDPLNTDEFQAYARNFVVAQATMLNEKWGLGFSGVIATNDIGWFQADPKTNAVIVSAHITNRFYLQITQGRIELFEDHAHYPGSSGGDEQKMKAMLKLKNGLTKKEAVQLARQALHQLGLDEKQLQLPEPPEVTQLQWPMPGQTELHKFPFYDVTWRTSEQELPLVKFQFSGITKKVTMYANNCEHTPKFPLPTNYSQILGLLPTTK